MNLFDYILLAGVAYFAFVGYRRGFLIMFFTFLALFVGLYFALHFSDYLEGKLNDEFSLDKLYVAPVAFCLTFLAVGAVVYFLGKTLHNVLKITPLGWFNHLAGVIFSVFKFLLIVLAVILFLNGMLERKGQSIPNWQTESVLLPKAQRIGAFCLPGLEESSILLLNALDEEQSQTGLSIPEILKAKETADSLNVDIENAQQLKKLHEQHP